MLHKNVYSNIQKIHLMVTLRQTLLVGKFLHSIRNSQMCFESFTKLSEQQRRISDTYCLQKIHILSKTIKLIKTLNSSIVCTIKLQSIIFRHG